jgi:hypothetical protein
MQACRESAAASLNRGAGLPLLQGSAEAAGCAGRRKIRHLIKQVRIARKVVGRNQIAGCRSVVKYSKNTIFAGIPALVPVGYYSCSIPYPMSRQVKAAVQCGGSAVAPASDILRIVLRQSIFGHHSFEVNAPFDRVESNMAGFFHQAHKRLLGQPLTQPLTADQFHFNRGQQLEFKGLTTRLEAGRDIRWLCPATVRNPVSRRRPRRRRDVRAGYGPAERRSPSLQSLRCR